MDLKDTIELMTSTKYEDRLRAEYYQAKIRHKKLRGILVRSGNGFGGYKPKCDMDLLVEQAKCMRDYISILELRAKRDGIDL